MLGVGFSGTERNRGAGLLGVDKVVRARWGSDSLVSKEGKKQLSRDIGEWTHLNHKTEGNQEKFRWHLCINP